MKPYRIIVQGTGLVGQAVLRDLINHPSYEIAAVLVSSDDKAGKDIGDIIGIAPTGIIATNNAEQALACEADALAYFGPSALYADINMANLTAALRAGKNVVDTSMGMFQNPARAPEELVDEINNACREGNSSFFSGGIDPGFGNDLFPLTLTGLCARVDSVRTTEFIDAGTYPDQEALIQLGMLSDVNEPALLDSEGMMTMIWGGPLYMIADALGVTIEETREVYKRWPAPERVEFERGVVEPGHTAAQRMELIGMVNGEPRIIVDHVHRAYPDAAPEWLRPQLDKSHANRIEIQGSPNAVQETVFTDSITGDGNGGTCLATGMRAINAIPAVCAAEPGILSTLDLPLIAGPGGMH